ENLNDSVVAPLFWFVLFGLPGAALYRYANTADAMWGYPGERNGRDWQWAGKWAARVDDVLSWIPARITALLLALAVWRWPRGLWCEAHRTPSPNSGWPMAAMALSLGVRLGKPGVYMLHAAGRAAAAGDLSRAVSWCGRVVWLAALTATCALAFRQ
ncbi:MAG: cobalamin biosynthesis protein, partial [Variovorax sp.]